MEAHVTVIFDDKSVYVNGLCFEVDLQPKDDIHAIQWHDGQGTIEYIGNKIPVKEIAGHAEYNTHVAPHVDLWQQEHVKYLIAAETARKAEAAGVSTCGCGAHNHNHTPSEEFNILIGDYLADFAAQRGWDSVAIVLSQTGIFSADAAIMQTAYDDVWFCVHSQNLEEKYVSQTISAEDVISLLPTLSWEQ